jgi:hypothetical protein
MISARAESFALAAVDAVSCPDAASPDGGNAVAAKAAAADHATAAAAHKNNRKSPAARTLIRLASQSSFFYNRVFLDIDRCGQWDASEHDPAAPLRSSTRG